jgi:uncharacterized LabA/DUF88 family protein
MAQGARHKRPQHIDGSGIIKVMKKPFAKKSKPAEQVAYAFIDSQNLNLGVQKVGWKMDWRKFLHYLQTEHNVKKAFLFIGYLPEYEAMYEQLHDLGYYIVLKPTVGLTPLPDKDGKPTDKPADAEERKPIVKGNIDAELVLYAMKELSNYQKAIIVSGDGDFLCLVEYLADRKRLLHLMAPNWRYSSLLKPYEPYIIRLDQLRGKLEHKDYRKKQTNKHQ